MFKINKDSRKILSDDMCIDLDDLKAKIESCEIRPHSTRVSEAIDTLCGFIGEKTADEVNEYCYSLIGKMESEPDFILDSLRMAFFRFISGGLMDLFVYQENEAWYPKIILSKVLCPNDIASLDESFLIYRGCDASEYKSGRFGQSWTTNKDIAENFAFVHYDSQEWFDKKQRIVIQSKFEKCNALFSDQTEYGEYEIVVKSGMPTLTDVKIIL